MNPSPQTLVLASNNAGKLKEFTALLTPLGYQLAPQKAFQVSEIEEPHPSFVENALAKARHASEMTGLPALADDSGLSVPALAGQPGVHSARYAAMYQAGQGDADNNQYLLQQMQGIDNRRACFVAVLALVRHAQDPLPLIAQGLWWGEIAHEPRGDRGFGYDPLFWLPEQACTVAELSEEEKNRHSHRGQALKQLLTQLSCQPITDSIAS